MKHTVSPEGGISGRLGWGGACLAGKNTWTNEDRCWRWHRVPGGSRVLAEGQRHTDRWGISERHGPLRNKRSLALFDNEE